MNEFETMTKGIPDDAARLAIIDVCDTLLVARQWFQSNGVEHTAADLIEVAKLILTREGFSR